MSQSSPLQMKMAQVTYFQRREEQRMSTLSLSTSFIAKPGNSMHYSTQKMTGILQTQPLPLSPSSDKCVLADRVLQ